MSVALKHASEPPPSLLERRPDCPVRLAAAVDRCLAKDPADRFASMDDLVEELEACLAELDSRTEEDATLIVAPAKPPPQPPPRERRTRRLLPTFVLLFGVPTLAAIVAILILERDQIRDALPLVGSKSVSLRAVGTYDPYPGDGAEHDEFVRRATDGKSGTYWPTEVYESWFKDGVGLVLAAREAERLTEVTVRTSTPGFPARIRAGPSPAGPWQPVSARQLVRRKTTFDLDLDGGSFRYYQIWLQLPKAPEQGVAHINDVTARA